MGPMSANPHAGSLALTTDERLVERGIEQGREETTRQSVQRWLAEGVSISEISALCGASEAEVP